MKYLRGRPLPRLMDTAGVKGAIIIISSPPVALPPVSCLARSYKGSMIKGSTITSSGIKKGFIDVERKVALL